MRAKTAYVTAYTSVMILLTVLFQSLRVFFPTLSTMLTFGSINTFALITGTLVNMCLLISAWNAGLVSGIVVSIAVPLTAFVLGHLAIPNIPTIAVSVLGNIIFCVIAWVPYATSITRFALTVIAALAKFGVMSLLNANVIIPIFLPSAADSSKLAALTSALNSLFSWQQLVIALAGGLLAYAIAPRLPRLTT